MSRPRKPRRSLPLVGTSETGAPYFHDHPEYIGPHFVAYHGVTPRACDAQVFVVAGTLGGEAIWQPKDGTLYFPPIRAATARGAALCWLADQIEEMYIHNATDGEIAVVHAGMLRLAAEMGLAIPARPTSRPEPQP